ncbi:MAG: mechanosensitive ion channel family protein [Myxococcota bacterium]
MLTGPAIVMAWNEFWANEHSGQAVASLILALLVLLGRSVGLRLVRDAAWSTEQVRMRWLAQVKRLAILLFLFGLVVVWASQLRELALSIVAVAAALAIATKEVLLCVLGGMTRASTRSFQVGDRIEVNGIRGDVVDHGVIATTVLEIGPGHQRTGRYLSVPNSVFLLNTVINESGPRDYVLHVVRVPMKLDEPFEEAAEIARLAAEEVCADFIEPAQAQLSAVASTHGLTPRPVKPRVLFQFPDSETVDMLIRVPVPSRERGRVEQALVRKLASWRRAERARVDRPSDPRLAKRSA